MDGLITALIIAGLIVVLILLIYLIDRVNSIERETRTLKMTQVKPSLGPFAGLSGRKLWDAVTGGSPPGVDPDEWVRVRDRYALVLQLHIESLFAEGRLDAQRGLSGEPKNPRIIANPHGNVESWLPTAQVNTLYKCGMDSTNATEEALMGVRAMLNEVGRSLYQQTGLAPVPVQSDLLLPGALPPLPSLVDPALMGDIDSGLSNESVQKPRQT
jgi:hypothetical protein